jgi:hypothetical protein
VYKEEGNEIVNSFLEIIRPRSITRTSARNNLLHDLQGDIMVDKNILI